MGRVAVFQGHLTCVLPAVHQALLEVFYIYHLSFPNDHLSLVCVVSRRGLGTQRG